MIKDRVEKHFRAIAKNRNQASSLFMSRSESCYYAMALIKSGFKQSVLMRGMGGKWWTSQN